jgi:hypothetical protein
VTQPCGEEQLPLDDYLPGADEDDGGHFDRALYCFDRQQRGLEDQVSLLGMPTGNAAEVHQ